ADAFNRGVDEVDWVEALSMMVDDILREENQDFLKHGSTGRLTHTLDLAEACWCTGQVAEGLGRGDIADTMSELAENWRNAYDPGTGILRSSEYYEGGAWNYSFRLLHDMKSRIGLVGREQFVTQLDKFFGYGEPSVKQPRDPHDGEYIQRGLKLNRFEGFNNESDMETPFAYIYAGRHDRTAEVVRSSMKSSFSTGRGGLPGNNDSGGLTSTFIWNAIGLFPVVGQREILVGSPAFDSVVLKTDDWKFAIIAKNNSEQNVYVGGAELNGKRLNRPFIPLEDFRDGGELRLEMQAEPMKW
ncbi:MAG: glycoside hydrolase domain-containing protein, partial [Planctomycetota bacterium]